VLCGQYGDIVIIKKDIKKKKAKVRMAEIRAPAYTSLCRVPD
tara:strand:+ start:1720 stop:1845 length:126 start_codon:yes stop_codon:yes gene_type:complete